ncbi:ABC transporter, ATP-binding protein [Corynebacterium efficiens YS-314]|uniref:Putative nitrate transport ATP-binding protein n=1 Tax=Corynebacterium efficiens (strain DSM 44549 / YS-314 / AJ 12310 / JCM 11189 / NBRC 100395) TaxID=196164 RepID=Q8FPX0_COREF|nr:ATP-binding cassette domain-containing protein [Corynebacterium efficiens]EEW50652.1 ABC transporter, ATP-binding protein [Corynebacterium efficiens YS-314]BAC18178.1 putative nitrate transport ATP-binding protein [Corynebacterium efficiens YS-314]
MTNAITIDQITRSYGTTRIIGPTTVDIVPGQFVSLLGPSGCGKSTILSMIAGLDQPSTGAVTVDGRSSVVFQDHALLPWFTARGNIEFGLKSVRPELSAPQRREIADRHLEMVGLSHAADRRPARLSGGMQQRVGIARAFAVEPEILLLDEPFGALDALTRRELQLQLLELWEADRRTVVMVTHDVDEAILLSDRILVMSPSPDATVIADIAVDLLRPRSNVDPDPALRHELIDLLHP